MAETFLAEKRGAAGFVQHVCLKRILPEHNDNPAFVRFFQKEARVAALLRHPNIVTVHDFGEERGVWWMALELVDGVDLRSLLAALHARGQSLSREMSFHIVIEVAKALAHAHARTLEDGRPARIVHRDMSPSNVLISREGVVKLSDFGLAWSAHDERTKSGVVRGKMSYMAPEQACGDACDGRADLFSLGVMLHELLTGRRPYEGRTEPETAMNLGAGRRTSQIRFPDFPPYVVLLVEGLLELDVEQRVESASKLLELLFHLTPPPPTYRELAQLVATVPVTHDHQLTSADVGASWGADG